MGKGASKVLAVEHLSGLWICGDIVEDKRKCVDAYMIILKGYAIARSLLLWLFLCHGTANSRHRSLRTSILCCRTKIHSAYFVFYDVAKKNTFLLFSLFSLQFTNYYPVSSTMHSLERVMRSNIFILEYFIYFIYYNLMK